jgi:hypothetical protein
LKVSEDQSLGVGDVMWFCDHEDYAASPENLGFFEARFEAKARS